MTTPEDIRLVRTMVKKISFEDLFLAMADMRTNGDYTLNHSEFIAIEALVTEVESLRDRLSYLERNLVSPTTTTTKFRMGD